jgi:hypothetical protein
MLLHNKESAVEPAISVYLDLGALIVLVVLLLGETTINYIDRQVVPVLAPTIRNEFQLSNSQYAAILNAFLAVRRRLFFRRLVSGPIGSRPRTEFCGRLVVFCRNVDGTRSRPLESGSFPRTSGRR